MTKRNEPCRYAHNDPTRKRHRCNPTCGMSDAEALAHMRTQPIRLHAFEAGRYSTITSDGEIGPPLRKMKPARSFVPRLVPQAAS